MKGEMEVTLRNALSSDLQSIMELVKSVDRMISAEEVRTWMAVDPGGQFLAETPGHGKTLVGICCGTRLGPDLGFMGLYVVREEFRGRGIGHRLWKAAKDHLGDRNIGVRGDKFNFQNYEQKEGFGHLEDYEIHYYECFGNPLPASIDRPSEVDVATFVEGRLVGLWKDLSNDQAVGQPMSSGDILLKPSRFADERSDANTNQIRYGEGNRNKSVTTASVAQQADRASNARFPVGSCGSGKTSASPVAVEGGVITPTNPTLSGSSANAFSAPAESNAIEDAATPQTDKALYFKDGKFVVESVSPSSPGQFTTSERNVFSPKGRHSVGRSSVHADVEEVNALVNRVLFIDGGTGGQEQEKTGLSCDDRDFQLRSASPGEEVTAPPSEMSCGKDKGLSLQPESETLRIYWGGADIMSEVVAFDRGLHRRDRSYVMRQTFSWPSCRSKVALNSGRVVGYGCLRSVVTDHWIVSPFYADSEAIAEVILFDLLQGFDFRRAPKGVSVRFPDKNVSCRRLVERFGFRRGEDVIMTGFTKRCLQVDTSKVYSFHSVVFCSE